MNQHDAAALAEEIAELYNPDGLVPFPFEKIQEEKKDLAIFLVDEDVLPDDISGAISFEKKEKQFQIFINEKKPKTRQYFTIAHELGYYFLHPEFVKTEEVIIDGESFLDTPSMLFRLDEQNSVRFETEANNFAAALIMPQHFVQKAWHELKSVEACAKVFGVSITAMSIRLERLGIFSW